MSEIQSWSATAASNNSASPNGWPEAMAPSGVNNPGREMMAALAKWYKDGNGSLTSGGSANAYTLSPNRTIAAYAAGVDFLFLANHANTGAATLNVSSLGAKDIRDRNGVALTSGDIASGGIVHVVYDNSAGYFRATNIIVGSGASPALDDLSDVAISTPISGNVLTYNGSSWINSGGGATTLGTAINYIPLPGGLVVQTGNGTAFAGTDTTITFGTVFATRCIHISMTPEQAADTTETAHALTLTDYSTTSASTFRVRNNNSADVYFKYMAFGY